MSDNNKCCVLYLEFPDYDYVEPLILGVYTDFYVFILDYTCLSLNLEWFYGGRFSDLRLRYNLGDSNYSNLIEFIRNSPNLAWLSHSLAKYPEIKTTILTIDSLVFGQ